MCEYIYDLTAHTGQHSQAFINSIFFLFDSP